MKRLAILMALTLAACGADGEPERPAPKAGLTVSGSVEIGVTGRG